MVPRQPVSLELSKLSTERWGMLQQTPQRVLTG